MFGDIEEVNPTVFQSSGIKCRSWPKDCRQNEICVKRNAKTDFGICQCRPGFTRNIDGKFIKFFGKFKCYYYESSYKKMI